MWKEKNDRPMSDRSWISHLVLMCRLCPHVSSTGHVSRTLHTDVFVLLPQRIIGESQHLMYSSRPGSWSRGAPRTKMEVLVMDHEVLVLVSVLKKKSCSFSRLLLWARHGLAFCETTKAVFHSEATVWENLLRSMHISLSWEGI